MRLTGQVTGTWVVAIITINMMLLRSRKNIEKGKR